MDWNIDLQTPMCFKDGKFIYNNQLPEDSYEEELEMEAQIKEIKEQVLLKDRPLFFK